MGEVYRAHDLKLGRDVALKMLPPAFQSDADRLARFEREARALAALNHPNIATIHGLEEHAGVHALVLELVEGQTLAEIIEGYAGTPRRMPIAETLAIARQIADALDSAHERGIVHRDLKPANIKVTGDGLVKVLDFGLAKAMDAAASSSWNVVDLSRSPTMAGGATQSGVILGTAAYMSPEQARGKPVDKRADIWAFGCVLYEMLTCRVAFPGETLSDVLVSILDRVPDWSAVPSGAPPTVMRLLRRCLEKEARKRLRDIGDARLDLEDAFSAAEGAVAADTSRLPVRHVEFQRLTDVEGLKEAPAVSPDGKMVAFVAMVAGKRQIWIRLLAGGAVLQLTRDDADHTHPRWAPDSSTLIYFTPAATESDAGTVWEIGALGGWPRRIATAIGAADISHDGQRIAMLQSSEDQLALVVASRDGSRGNRVVFLPTGSYAYVRWAPDDRSIAYQRLAHGGFDGHVEVASLATGERHEVARGTWLQGFAWLPDGSGFVYSSSRGSTLLYPPVFNLRAVLRDGSGDRQLTFGDHSYVEPDVHASGKLIAGRTISRSDIWRFPIGGSPLENTTNAVPITRQTGQIQVPSASPDDREVVFVSDTGGHANLWITRTDGSGTRPITFETDPEAAIGVPAWSPRGDVIAFVRTERATAGVWAVRPDGSGLRQMVQGWGPCWSADGRWLYYWRLGVEPGRVERIPSDGGAAEIIREEEALNITAISPDGATLFVARPVQSKILGQFGTGFLEFARASPPDGPCETMAQVAGARLAARVWGIALSPDGQYLAMSLIDGATTNLWILPTAGGPMTPVTDFGERSVMITRNVSWSRDSQHIYAAVAEIQTDVVLLDGLI
jgi:Tol biopolymer transport system component/tRNA A-37 threonylcarbamoyl transferase component Bud32